MGWGNTEKAPPQAFSGVNADRCWRAISQLANDQRAIIMQDMKMEEIAQLLFPASDRDSLTRAFSLCKPMYPDQQMVIPLAACEGYIVERGNPAITLSWNASTEPGAFYAPTDDAYRLAVQMDAPLELREKYEHIFSRLVQIGYEWGMVRYVFDALNKNGYCNTPAQMRYVWPAIRHIVAKYDDKLANSLIDSSARAGDKARVPPAVAPLLVPTVNIVARSTLVEPPKKGDARTGFTLTTMPTGYSFEGCSFKALP